VRCSQWEYSLHTTSSKILRLYTNQTGYALGGVMAPGFAFVELSNSASVTCEVELDALFLQRPARGPQSAVAHVVEFMTLAPWVADHAAQRSNDNQAEEHCCSAKKTLHGLTTTKSGSLPGVVQKSGQSTTVNLIGRSVVATLYRNLFRHILLHELNDGKAQSDNGHTSSQIKQWGVKVVPIQGFFTVDLEFLQPEHVDAQECKITDDRNNQPNVDSASGTLFSRIAGDWETLLAERYSHVVQFSAKGCELFVAHSLEFIIGVVSIYIAHERDPIHIAAAHSAVMPIIHIARPSATGPRPPRPQPAGEGVSLADLM